MDTISNKPMKGNARKDLIEGLYRLSGLQQGMLFHGLYDKEAAAYIKQFSCNLIRVDLDEFKKSWHYILKRHTILRSGFNYDAFALPVQFVYRDVELPVDVLDYRHLAKDGQESAIKRYQEQDRDRGFDFTTPPLMRLALIRISEE